jgi:hypothetical protein
MPPSAGGGSACLGLRGTEKREGRGGGLGAGETGAAGSPDPRTVSLAEPTNSGDDPEFKAIRKLIDEVQERTGLVEGATPSKSGRFVVRMPRSLHASLELEAAREGVSLNQWVVAKLAIQVGCIMGHSST